MNSLEQEVERNRKMEQKLNNRMARGSASQIQQGTNQALAPQKRPGNVGDINSVIWPFWFTFTAPELTAATGSNGFITVTQEAAFIFMAMSKVVFKRTGIAAPYQYTAINALLPDEGANSANDVLISIRDAQSTRVFFGQPMSIDQIGCAEEPTILPTPQLMLPNATIECVFQNNSVDTYVPFITLFGYRIRLENAADILSTITG